MDSIIGTSEQLVLPALRANIGDWTYFIASMKISDVAARVNIAHEIHSSSTLNDLIQRALDKRAEEIKNFIVQRSDRFFNSLVIGVYDGDPTWYDLAIHENPYLDTDQIPGYVEDALGVLVLTGGEKLFALDGQHRVVGIRYAIQTNPDLGDEQIAAIFVTHRNDAPGLTRTRRLFTALNRYAKPISSLDKIALDEDDAVAIITRRLINDYPLFHGGKILSRSTKNLPQSEKQAFTTIVALYDMLNRYLQFVEGMKSRQWNQFKRNRPGDIKLESLYALSEDLWKKIAQKFPPIRKMEKSPANVDAALPYRNGMGGHLLFRPIGLDVFMVALIRLMKLGWSLDDSIKQISKVPMNLSEWPWVGLLWDITNGRMITAPENKKTASSVLFYAAGGILNSQEELNLVNELEGLTGKVVDLDAYFDL